MSTAREARNYEVYKELSVGGEPLMSLADYGFSRKYGWVKDQFGVSWQLNRP